jgi:hypothetical protein
MAHRYKTLLLFLAVYIGQIASFGFIYWVYFFFNPDAFVIPEEFNLHPFSSEIIIGETGTSLATFQKKADSLRILQQLTEKDLYRTIKLSDSLQLIADHFGKIYQDSVWQKFGKWQHQYIPDSLREKLAAIDTIMNYLSDTSSSYASGLKVERAKLQYQLTQLTEYTSDYLLLHVHSFDNPALRRSYEKFDSVYKQVDSSIVSKNVNVMRQEKKIQNLKFKARNYYSRRIIFLDFLLFSASNSSTVTYGEIIPNDSWIRFFLFLQAISCIILIAVGLDSIVKS